MLYNLDIKTIYTCKFDEEFYQKTMLAFFLDYTVVEYGISRSYSWH